MKNITTKKFIMYFLLIGGVIIFLTFAYINFLENLSIQGGFDVFAFFRTFSDSGFFEIIGMILYAIVGCFIIFAFPFPLLFGALGYFNIYLIIAYILNVIIAIAVLTITSEDEQFYSESDFDTTTIKTTYDYDEGTITETVTTPKDKADRANFWMKVLLFFLIIGLPFISYPVILFMLIHNAPFSKQKWYATAPLMIVALAIFIGIGYGFDYAVKNEFVPTYTYEVIKREDGMTPYIGQFTDGDAVIITSYNKNKKEIIIPSNIDGLPVVQIASLAFSKASKATKIIVPSSVKIIESGAFYGTSNLKSITLPFLGNTKEDNVDYYFSERSVLGYIFGGVEYSESYLANGYYLPITLTEVIITDEMHTLAADSFKGMTSLENCEIPSGIVSIENSAFYGTINLKSITLTTGLKTIGYSAFSECGIESINIPNGVTRIGDAAFAKSQLKSINIPASVNYIGAHAFNSAVNLEAIVFDEDSSLTTIEAYTFAGTTNLKSIIIPSNVTRIGNNAFSEAIALETIIIPSNVTHIGNNAFSEAIALETITFDKDSSLTTIGDYAFGGTKKLKSIIIPSKIVHIGKNAFREAISLETITFDKDSDLKTIEDYAFAGTINLKSIVLPDGVKSIGSFAFSEARSLTSIIIPNSVTFIGSDVFGGTASLESITIPFVGISREATDWQAVFGIIFGKTEYDETYEANGYYLPNTLKEVIVTDATTIGGGAFREAYSLTSIVIPNSVTNIGNFAFYKTGLTSFVIPSSVTSIGSYAFNSVYGLNSIVIPSSVIYIGELAFNSLSSKFYLEADSKPSGWSANWYFYNYSEFIYWSGQWHYDMSDNPVPNN